MKTKRILSIVANALIWVIFLICLLLVISTLNTKGGISNIFGTGYLSVQSDSMEPQFKEGDIIFVRTTSKDSKFEEDDVVTFYDIKDGEMILNTHRIISYRTIGDVRYYTTQGDNSEYADSGEITAGDIVAKWTGKSWSGMGKVVDYLQSSSGFFIFIVLPLAVLFIYQIISFSLLMSRYKKKAVVDVESLDEAQKEEIARQYLESLKEKEHSKEKETKD